MSKNLKAHIFYASILGLFGVLVSDWWVGGIIFLLTLAIPFGETTNAKKRQVVEKIPREPK